MMPEAEPRLADASFELRAADAVFSCRVCANEFGLEDGLGKLAHDEREAIHFLPELAHTFLSCPSCDSSDFSVTSGRGVWIERIEGEAD